MKISFGSTVQEQRQRCLNMKATPHKMTEGNLPKNKALSKNKENATQEQRQQHPIKKTALPKCNKEIRQQ